MPAPILVIGSGGSGMAVLLQLKERLIEMYGKVPDSIAFLQIDTQEPRDSDEFHGIHLEIAHNISTSGDQRGPEFESATTVDEKTKIEVIYENHNQNKPGWDWVDTNRLKISLIGAADRTIAGGAKQHRPLGRAALFLRSPALWNRLRTTLTWLSKQPSRASARYVEEAAKQGITIENLDAQKRQDIDRILVFVVGSVSGGTGAGTILDLGALVRRAAESIEGLSQNLHYIGVLIGPRIFTGNWDGQLPPAVNDTSNNKNQETLGLYSNAYAFFAGD